MKEAPVLFSAPMVRALLDGSKTQTRRVAKLVDGRLARNVGSRQRELLDWHEGAPSWRPHGGSGPQPVPPDVLAKFCPYGKPGDRLWVKEKWGVLTDTWTDYGWEGEGLTTDLRVKSRADLPCSSHRRDRIVYAAGCSYPDEMGSWRSSLHMSRALSRITLEIDDVRVERLHDISEEDAMQEGAGFLLPEYEQWDGDPDQYRKCFRVLWESIHGPDSWSQNPWLWVITFKNLRATPQVGEERP